MPTRAKRTDAEIFTLLIDFLNIYHKIWKFLDVINGSTNENLVKNIEIY